MRILGINAVFHDPAAALIVDGDVVAAAEEERFTRRKHGKQPVPFSAWEAPEQSALWCLEHGGITAADLDAVAYSYDPSLAEHGRPGVDPGWEWLRSMYAHRAPQFLRTCLPGLDPGIVRFVPHHVAHAASAALAAPFDDCAVLVADGRGECASYLAGEYRDGKLEELAQQALPHSIGLMYEKVTAHLGFARASDEYKVMALASYGIPRFADRIAATVGCDGTGGFHTEPLDFGDYVAPRRPGEEPGKAHADLAASVQRVVEDMLLSLAGWLHTRTGRENLAIAGGVGLNCVANTRLYDQSPFANVWVQPAAGDAGTALGAALQLAAEHGEAITPMPGADLGREWSDTELERILTDAGIDFDRPADLAATVAQALAEDRLVAWFQGRAEYGPRALGHRSLLAHPGNPGNLERLNRVKGREQFRPVAPMVLADRAADIFTRGPLPSPYMLFVHDVAREWRDRIPTVTHVDGTARVQTVSPDDEPLLADMLTGFEARTDLPVVVNTSLNVAGKPIVDSPTDALECFGSTPVDLLAIGPFTVTRP